MEGMSEPEREAYWVGKRAERKAEKDARREKRKAEGYGSSASANSGDDDNEIDATHDPDAAAAAASQRKKKGNIASAFAETMNAEDEAKRKQKAAEELKKKAEAGFARSAKNAAAASGKTLPKNKDGNADGGDGGDALAKGQKAMDDAEATALAVEAAAVTTKMAAEAVVVASAKAEQDERRMLRRQSMELLEARMRAIRPMGGHGSVGRVFNTRVRVFMRRHFVMTCVMLGKYADKLIITCFATSLSILSCSVLTRLSLTLTTTRPNGWSTPLRKRSGGAWKRRKNSQRWSCSR
jgi:hypothetical protein